MIIPSYVPESGIWYKTKLIELDNIEKNNDLLRSFWCLRLFLIHFQIIILFNAIFFVSVAFMSQILWTATIWMKKKKHTHTYIKIEIFLISLHNNKFCYLFYVFDFFFVSWSSLFFIITRLRRVWDKVTYIYIYMNFFHLFCYVMRFIYDFSFNKCAILSVCMSTHLLNYKEL